MVGPIYSFYRQLFKLLFFQLNIITQMIYNIDELDDLDILKLQIYPKLKGSDQYKRLYLYRNYTHFRGLHLAKIYSFWNDKKSKDSKIVYLNLLTQTPIFQLNSFVQVLQQTLNQQQFSDFIQKVQKYKQEMKIFLKNDFYQYSSMMKDFKDIEFGIFGTKDKNFLIKAITKQKLFSYTNLKQAMKLVQTPPPLQIKNGLLIQKLMKQYQKKKVICDLSPKKYLREMQQQFYSKDQLKMDQFVLKLKLQLNYPFLRLTNMVKVNFNDDQTKQKIKGPIFGNQIQECMYGHLISYSFETINKLKAQNCPECSILIQNPKENKLLNFLRDNVFNPSKSSILYCPQYNRFKTINTNGVLAYANYFHFRSNVKKNSTKARYKINKQLQLEKQQFLFEIRGKKIMISDPVRGKYCEHYSFTDLRLYYLNCREDNRYQCPICHQIIKDLDIIYLHETQILFKYISYKLEKIKNGSNHKFNLIFNHFLRKVFIEDIQNKILGQEIVCEEIKHFYETLVDPFVSFDQYSLQIPDKRQKQLKQRLLYDQQAQFDNKSQDEEDI